MFVSTFERINNETDQAIESEKPQICAQYVTAPNGTTASKRIRTTFRTNSDGNCEVDFYGACFPDGVVYSLIPKADNEFGIGIAADRWKNMYLGKFFSLRGPSDYFEVTAGESNKFGSVETTMSITVKDWVSANYVRIVYNRFFKGNLIGRDAEKLYIRSSTTMDASSNQITDNDMWLIAGNYFSEAASYNSVVSLAGGNFNTTPGSSNIASAITSQYKAQTYYQADSWIFDEMTKYKGGLYLSGNGYLYLMGSAVFMENALPGADLSISLGIEDDGTGKPKAFQNVVTNRISNNKRDVIVASNLIPELTKISDDIIFAPLGINIAAIYYAPSLGNPTNRFLDGYIDNMYCKSINIDTNIKIGNTNITSDTITVNNLNVTGLASIQNLKFVNSYAATSVKTFAYTKTDNVVSAASNVTLDTIAITQICTFNYSDILNTGTMGSQIIFAMDLIRSNNPQVSQEYVYLCSYDYKKAFDEQNTFFVDVSSYEFAPTSESETTYEIDGVIFVGSGQRKVKIQCKSLPTGIVEFYFKLVAGVTYGTRLGPNTSNLISFSLTENMIKFNINNLDTATNFTSNIAS